MAQSEAFETVAVLSFSINDVQQLLLKLGRFVEAISPVVSRSTSFRTHEDVFLVEEISNIGLLNRIDHSRFEIEQDSARNKVFVVCLVKEHIFPVLTVHRKLFQLAIFGDAMLLTQFLPELSSDLIAALADLD